MFCLPFWGSRRAWIQISCDSHICMRLIMTLTLIIWQSRDNVFLGETKRTLLATWRKRIGTSFGRREIDVPEEVITYVDENVLASKDSLAPLMGTTNNVYSELPPGTQVNGIFPHGASYWTRTAETETEQADVSPRSFFRDGQLLSEISLTREMRKLHYSGQQLNISHR